MIVVGGRDGQIELLIVSLAPVPLRLEWAIATAGVAQAIASGPSNPTRVAALTTPLASPIETQRKSSIPLSAEVEYLGDFGRRHCRGKALTAGGHSSYTDGIELTFMARRRSGSMPCTKELIKKPLQ